MPVFYFFSLLDFLAALPVPAFCGTDGMRSGEKGGKKEERKNKKEGKKKGIKKEEKKKKAPPHAAQRHGGGLTCDFGIGVCNVTWEIAVGECFTRGVAPGAGETIICTGKFELGTCNDSRQAVTAVKHPVHI